MGLQDGAKESAADLLRQAMIQNSTNVHDQSQDHDQLHSAGTTPPDVATPHPDPSDRRFPGILASYFGQVCYTFPTSTSFLGSVSSTTSAARMKHGISTQATPHGAEPGEGDLPTAPNSPAAPVDTDHSLPLFPRDRPTIPPTITQHDYPTPPMSSCSSLKKTSSNSSVVDGVASGNDDSVGMPSPRRRSSARDTLFSTMRRLTLTTKPLTSITTTSPVHASHISYPGLVLTPNSLSCPVVERYSAFSPPNASLPLSEHTRLTEDVTLSRNQSTPPRTPRTLSHDSKTSRKTSPCTGSALTSKLDEQAKRRRGSTSPHGVVGKEVKGRLSVSITEGRGLRPSTDPYVVCQFQWNEYISKGPRSNGNTGGDENGTESPVRGISIPRTGSDVGRPMAIPMKSRQSSHTSITLRESKGRVVTDPVWNHDAVFDVVGEHAEIDISVYDNISQETFLGHVRFCPNIAEDSEPLDKWFKLEPRGNTHDHISGEIHLRVRFQRIERKHVGPEDFQILKLIGKGTFGQVFQARKRDTQRVYAMKVLSKKVIVQKKEVAHTVGERNILVRTAMADSPFIVGLKFSFQTPSDLYLVTDYMSGGELFWHLQKEGRFPEDRAKFYIAELILALQHLHQHDIVYRDLKPENILLDANGHIALCDFGLSKANLPKDETTNTFCGTTEYLAPEVLLDEQGYTKMVDFWSLGVLVFEMCCGWSPFYAEDTQQMYKNIAFGKVRFPRDALSSEGRNFVKSLLNRNPKHRLGAKRDAEELKEHPFFADIDWEALAKKNLVPLFKPRLKSELDTSNFDPEFTNAMVDGNSGAESLNARAAMIASGLTNATTPLSPTMQANFKGFTFVDDRAMEERFSYFHNRYDEHDVDNDDEGSFLDEEAISRQTSRMSGIQQTGAGAEEEIFNNGQGFEV